MTEAAARKLNVFFRAFSGAPRPLLLVDYDGTMAAFRIDRFSARPWAGVSDLLKQIQTPTRTRIAVITGRPANEIAPMLALESPVEVWGLHGAERLHPHGRRELEQAPAASRTELDALRARLKRDALGGLYEDKANAAVVHWRGRTPARALAIEKKTRAIFEPLATLKGLALLEFDGGLELRIGRDKGGAVRAILREEKPGSPVTYLGDDLTDEAAFQAVNEAKGPHLSVLMRRARRETAAEVWLRPPAELRIFLQRWLEAAA
ncbi:MAG: trehalose-phosphatase [Terracidiphilus sp.]